MANDNNILNTAESATIIILQCIKIDLLEEKTRLQRKGAALEEPTIEDEPESFNDYLNGQIIEGQVTFDQLIEAQTNTPTPIEELVKAVEKDNGQLQTNIPFKFPDKKPPSNIRAKLTAWLVARSAWKIKKSELDYEYARTKADVVNLCYGIDFAIKLIDREIERQSNNKGLKVDNQ